VAKWRRENINGVGGEEGINGMKIVISAAAAKWRGMTVCSADNATYRGSVCGDNVTALPTSVRL